MVEAIRTGQAAPKNTESLAGGLEKVIAGAKPTTSTQAGHVTVFSVGINPELVRALEARRPAFRPDAPTSKRDPK